MPDKHTRIRRGNKEDAQQVRENLLQVAMEMFESQGVEGVSVRAVAARVGMSPMALYRYFENRRELLRALWFMIIHDLKDYLCKSIPPTGSARLRHRGMIRAFLDYWSEHPERFWLAYETQGLDGPLKPFPVAESHTATYLSTVNLFRSLTAEVARELGVADHEANMASDLCMTMMFGFLNSSMVNRRYPWTDMARMKEIFIEQTAQSVERFLLETGQSNADQSN